MKTTLIKCGWLVTMDPALGEQRDVELLVQGDRVLAIGQNLDAPHDEIIDASDMIVMPGLTDAHHHVWQTGMRGIGSDWLLSGYFTHMYTGMARLFGPRDNYLANLLGALAHIDQGVTSVFDFCHNVDSLEMAEASIDGLEESGIRAVFAHSPGVWLDDEPGRTPFSHTPHPDERVRALRNGRLWADDGRVSLALGVIGPHYGTLDIARSDQRLARELDLVTTSHATHPDAMCTTHRGYLALAREGLLGPDDNVVHANYVSDEELSAIVDSGATVTSTVLTELHLDMPNPAALRVRKLGGLPSLGIDVPSVVMSDMFSEMRAAMDAVRRALHRENEAAGEPPLSSVPLPAREVLRWATEGGAQAMGLRGRVGTLAPGMKADIVMLRATDLNLFPVYDPVSSIVCQAGPKNVDTVMVDGVIRKRQGRMLVDERWLAALRDELAESAARIIERFGYRPAG